MTSLLLTLCLVSAPVPLPKTDGIEAHQLTGEYYDIGTPESATHYRIVLSSGGVYWSHWHGTEYTGSWVYNKKLGCVVILERPVRQAGTYPSPWSLNVSRRKGVTYLNQLPKLR